MAAKWRHLQCEQRGFCFLICPSEYQEKSHRISVSTQDRSNAHFRKQIFERSRGNQEVNGRNFEALVAEIFGQINVEESQQNQPEKEIQEIMRISQISRELMAEYLPLFLPLLGAITPYKQRFRPHSFLTPKSESFREKERKRERERIVETLKKIQRVFL